MTITDSSKDYGENTLLLIFEGEYDKQEVLDYVSKNYSDFEINDIEVEYGGETWLGYQNPNSIYIK